MGWILGIIAAAIVAHAHSKASVSTPSGTTAQTGGTQVVPLTQVPSKNYLSTGFNPTAQFFLRWTKAPLPVAPSSNEGSAPFIYSGANAGQAISQPGGSGSGGSGGGGNQAPGGGFGGPSGRGFI